MMPLVASSSLSPVGAPTSLCSLPCSMCQTWLLIWGVEPVSLPLFPGLTSSDGQKLVSTETGMDEDLSPCPNLRSGTPVRLSRDQA